MLKFLHATLTGVLVLTSSATLADLKSAKKALDVGKWTVLRDVDQMTDKVTCTAVHKDAGPRVQLSNTGFYFSISGGLQSITLRYDEEPPLPLRLPTKMEKDIRAVILDGSAFEKVTSSARLRYQVLTLVSGVANGDLDLTGIDAAKANIAAGCPLPAAT